MLTDQLVYKESGHYDKEIIQHLRLNGLGIIRIQNLDNCVALVELILSHNEITSISGLDMLVSLKRLDLSFNKIQKIENLQHLTALESLDIKGNQIATLNDLEELAKVPTLRTLSLKGLEGEGSNPVCKVPSYMSKISILMPNLQVLDGGLLEITDSFQQLEDALTNLQPDASVNKTPPNEPWLDISTVQIPPYDGDFDQFLRTNKVFRSTLDLQEKITAMLNEDCTHLLRKASTILAKESKQST